MGLRLCIPTASKGKASSHVTLSDEGCLRFETLENSLHERAAAQDMADNEPEEAWPVKVLPVCQPDAALLTRLCAFFLDAFQIGHRG